jgi:hypothetical protein
VFLILAAKLPDTETDKHRHHDQRDHGQAENAARAQADLSLSNSFWLAFDKLPLGSLVKILQIDQQRLHRP